MKELFRGNASLVYMPFLLFTIEVNDRFRINTDISKTPLASRHLQTSGQALPYLSLCAFSVHFFVLELNCAKPIAECEASDFDCIANPFSKHCIMFLVPH